MKRMATWILAGGLVAALACAAEARPGPHGGPRHGPPPPPHHHMHGGPRHWAPPPPPPPPPPRWHRPPPPPPPPFRFGYCVGGPVVYETYSPAPVIRWCVW